ncbi:hypothetical protein GmHk_13G036860 [Glycine max]|nr:hypothetical protein GmHk_13G036860 [Glycine max]
MTISRDHTEPSILGKHTRSKHFTCSNNNSPVKMRSLFQIPIHQHNLTYPCTDIQSKHFTSPQTKALPCIRPL